MGTTFQPVQRAGTGRTLRNQRQVLLVNAGRARAETVNGRAYLVAPMTIIVPGVLNGSRGALLYPPSEVMKEPGLWNGVPICDGHPTENGAHVSGRTPATMASHWMGHVFNDRWDGAKRTAEGWFDVEATRRVNRAILNRLERGDSIELSTGLFTDNHDRSGTFNGRPYDAIAYNYRPDHLAILPDQRGACSREDGCGVMVNEGEGRDEAGKFAPGGGKDKGKAKDDGKPTELPKAALAGTPEAEQRVAKQTGNQSTDQSGPAKECKCGGSCGACAAEVSPAPVAKNAFCPTGSGGGQDNSCGGGGGSGSRKEANQASQAAAKASKEANDWGTKMGHLAAVDAHNAAQSAQRDAGNREQASYHGRMSDKHTELARKVTNQRSFLMAKGKKGGREETLDWLTTNSERFGAAEDQMAELPDDVLAEIRANAEHIEEKNLVCNTLAEMFPEVNEIVGNGGDLAAFLKSKMGGQDDGDEQDSELEPPQKVKNAGAACGEQKGTMMAGNRHANQNRAAKRLSLNEMIQQHGSDEDRSAWAMMIENEREQRRELLTRITANCASKEEARATWDSLKGDDLPKLKLLANRLAPKRAAGEDRGEGRGMFGLGRRIPDYGGAAGAVVGNRGRRGRDDDEDEPLGLPDQREILANERAGAGDSEA